MVGTTAVRRGARIESIETSVFRVPCDAPESDGTFAWDHTTMVLVEISAGGATGIGYTYAAAAAAAVVREMLAPVVTGRDPFDIPACWKAMTGAVRNNGDTGLCRMAIAAVDSALWDLKARLLEVPLARLLGMARESVPAYGSGGFTSYSVDRLRQQLGGWAREGFTMVKMKIGREPGEDPRRMATAREAIGDGVELFVDANEALDVDTALWMARDFSRLNVTWYEQPVRHRDLAGMSRIRSRLPPGIALSSGEYIFEADWARRIIEAGAVDVLQADATRCGVTGFLQVATLCEVYGVPLSSHCAPSLHLAVCCALPCVRHMEYFHDHVRIEQMLFHGAAAAKDGFLSPDLERPGSGLELNRSAASEFRVAG